jgi:hypothetical protein
MLLQPFLNSLLKEIRVVLAYSQAIAVRLMFMAGSAHDNFIAPASLAA